MKHKKVIGYGGKLSYTPRVDKMFAKYLPVEGEIKKGDWVKTILHLPSLIKQGLSKKDFDEELFQVGNITNDAFFVKDSGTWYYKEECRKLKLFLCSRDIQVGDKVQSLTDSLSPYWDLESDNDVRIAKDRGFFKVIGEILTPGIVENQEFTEKEAECLTIGK